MRAPRTARWSRVLIGLVATALLLTTTPVSAQTGPDRPDGRTEIVGGTDARSGEFPHQVGLLSRDQPNRFYAQFCGGSIISPTAVLTAAHCVEDRSAASLDILAGTVDLAGSAGQRVHATAVHLHPQYDSATAAWDAAIVEVATPLVGDPIYVVQPGHEQLFRAGTDVTITGWGALTMDGSFPIRLQKVTVPTTSDATCRGAYGSEYQASNMVCAGRPQGGKDSCGGDSGGPVARRAGSNWVQIGIVSWGFGCALAGFPGVNSRVSAMSAFIGPYLLPRPHPFYDVDDWLTDAVVWVYDNGFMSGFPDGTFGSSGNLTRAQAVRLLWRLVGEPAVADPHPLSDVPPWVEDAVRWAAHDPDGDGPQRPVIEGYPDGTFRPDASITRGEWTRVLHRVGGEATASEPHAFSDVPAWLTAAVSWITDPANDPRYAEGFPDGTYQPDAWITRGQTTRMVARIYGP